MWPHSYAHSLTATTVHITLPTCSTLTMDFNMDSLLVHATVEGRSVMRTQVGSDWCMDGTMGTSYEMTVNYPQPIRIERLCEDMEIILYSRFPLGSKRNHMLLVRRHIFHIVFTVCLFIFRCVFLFSYRVLSRFLHPLCFHLKSATHYS